MYALYSISNKINSLPWAHSSDRLVSVDIWQPQVYSVPVVASFFPLLRASTETTISFEKYAGGCYKLQLFSIFIFVHTKWSTLLLSKIAIGLWEFIEQISCLIPMTRPQVFFATACNRLYNFFLCKIQATWIKMEVKMWSSTALSQNSSQYSTTCLHKILVWLTSRHVQLSTRQSQYSWREKSLKWQQNFLTRVCK